MTVKEFREAQKQARKDYFRKNTSEKLSEGTGRYAFKDSSGDLENVGIYSPTIEELFGNGSFTSAMEAAESLQGDLVNQGERKIGINRNPYSIAVNIFAAAIGTERYDEPGVFGDAENKRIRNSAYAIIDKKTGEKVNIEWDITDPAQLSDDNREKYLVYQRKYRDPETIRQYHNKAAETHKKVQQSLIDRLSGENLEAFNKLQDKVIRDCFLKQIREWENHDRPTGVEVVIDTLANGAPLGIFHLDWRTDKGQKKPAEKDFETYLTTRSLFLAKSIEAAKAAERRGEKPIGLRSAEEGFASIKDAADYLEAFRLLWKKQILSKVFNPEKRRAMPLKQFVTLPYIVKLK